MSEHREWSAEKGMGLFSTEIAEHNATVRAYRDAMAECERLGKANDEACDSIAVSNDKLQARLARVSAKSARRRTALKALNRTVAGQSDLIQRFLRAGKEPVPPVIVDVPAGVPSVPELADLYRATRNKIDLGWNSPSGHIEAITAIRDAVLDGVTPSDLSDYKTNGYYPLLGEIRDILGIQEGVSMKATLRALVAASAPHEPTDAHVEALARVMRAAWAIQQEENPSDYEVSDFTVYARAAFAHIGAGAPIASEPNADIVLAGLEERDEPIHAHMLDEYIRGYCEANGTSPSSVSYSRTGFRYALEAMRKMLVPTERPEGMPSVEAPLLAEIAEHRRHVGIVMSREAALKARVVELEALYGLETAIALKTERDTLRDELEAVRHANTGLEEGYETIREQLVTNQRLCQEARAELEAVTAERASDEELEHVFEQGREEGALVNMEGIRAIRARVEAPLLAEIERLDIENRDRAFYVEQFAAVSQERDTLKARVAELEAGKAGWCERDRGNLLLEMAELREKMGAVKEELTALRPWLREPMGWELDVHPGKPYSGYGEPYVSFSKAQVSIIKDRIRPTFERADLLALGNKATRYENEREINAGLVAERDAVITKLLAMLEPGVSPPKSHTSCDCVECRCHKINEERHARACEIAGRKE